MHRWIVYLGPRRVWPAGPAARQKSRKPAAFRCQPRKPSSKTGCMGRSAPRRGAIGIYDHVLVEDDGPGIGADAPWMKTNRAHHRDRGRHVGQKGAPPCPSSGQGSLALRPNGRGH